MESSDDYDMKITGNRHSNFQTPHDKIFGTSQTSVSVEDKIFGKSSGSSFGSGFFNVNMNVKKPNINVDNFLSMGNTKTKTANFNVSNFLGTGSNTKNKKINYDMNRFFSMSTGDDKISKIMGHSNTPNLNFENKMNMFLPKNNYNDINFANKINMILPDRYGKNAETVTTQTGRKLEVYDSPGYRRYKPSASPKVEVYDVEQQPTQRLEVYQVKKQNPVLNYFKQGVEAGIEAIPRAIENRQQRLKSYREAEALALQRYKTAPNKLTAADIEMLSSAKQRRRGLITDIGQWGSRAGDNYLEGVEKASRGFSDVGSIPLEQNVGTLMGGWRDYSKVPSMKIGRIGREQIFKQGKKNYIQTEQGMVEVPKGYMSQMRGQPQQYEKIYNPLGIYQSKVDFAFPTSQPTNIPVVQYMSRIPQGSGGFETMSKYTGGSGFNMMAGLPSVTTSTDDMLNNTIQQMKAQPPQLVPQMPVLPAPQTQVAETAPMETRPAPATGGGIYSPYSKKTVTYTRGPYTKHTQPQQMGG